MRGLLFKSTLAVFALIALVIVAVMIIDRPQTTDPAVATVSNRPLVVPAAGYVGAASCQECHQEQFKSWHASYHRTMTQVISPATAPKAIQDTTVEVDGQSYQFQQDGDQYFVQLNDPTAGWQPRRRQLVMMTGSHHMHVFWYESDFEHTPAQLPVLYLRDQQRWIPRQSAFIQPPEEPTGYELGRWNQTCSNCHSTYPRQRLQKESRIWDTQVSDFGIACEACHGPGQGHIAFHRDKSGSRQDDQIVNPEQLPHESKSDLCGQCHSVHLWNFDVVSEDDFFQHGTTFRPGKALKDTPFIEVVQASPDHWQSEVFKKFAFSPRKLNSHFWPDGEVRVSGGDYTAMIESPCFQRGQLACISCHTMHEQDPGKHSQWRDDQLAAGMRGDQACIQCHGEYEQLGSAHTHHAAGSSGSECMNCHMPYTTYGLLKTIRSHRISSPSVQTTIQTGRPNACNLCHLDQTLEWAADHLAQWYGHEKPELTKDETSTSAAVLHLVKGDAAQRVIQASAFSWQAARDVSGTEWMPPFLMIGMDDPYDAIRIISERSFRSIGKWREFTYDFLDPPTQRAETISRELDAVKLPSQAGKSALLFDDQGILDMQRLNDLLKRRNKRPVELME